MLDYFYSLFKIQETHKDIILFITPFLIFWSVLFVYYVFKDSFKVPKLRLGICFSPIVLYQLLRFHLTCKRANNIQRGTI